MASDFDSFIENLTATDVEEAQKNTRAGKPEAEKPKFPCQQCQGTGKWSGGTNRHGNANCNACQGRGYFVTSEAERRKARTQTKARVQAAAKAHQADVVEVLGGEEAIERLRAMAEWSEFVRSVMAQFDKGWTLSDNQVRALQRTLARDAERTAARKAEAKARVENAPTVDLTPIKDMFLAAKANGHKRPKYRAEGFIINLAPDHGANAGHLYVKTEADCYMGKITPDMKFMGTRDSKGSGVEAALQTIAANPLEAAVRYGRRTGTCACCGRALDNAESVELGIGPICRKKWGLL